MSRVRRDVWKLDPQDETLIWYERAVKAMQSRPITDPTSWRFQAAIHDYTPGEDPLAKPGEQLPSSAIQQQFWMQCQHGSWFFLPWHRMYLHFFEQILLAEIKNLGGPSDWALPYWNYSESMQARLLPEAFRNPTLVDGTTPNALYISERDPRSNVGQQFAQDRDVDLRGALTQTSFSTPFANNFGGGPTRFSHTGSAPGILERVPHGAMHNAVAGASGWMGSFNTAGLDPIFWLHHANIDRLWQVWQNVAPTNVNPTDTLWLQQIAFPFHDANSAVTSMRCMDVVDTTALDYTYQDTSNPLSLAVADDRGLGLEDSIEESTPMDANIPPEIVGISDTKIPVDNTPTHIQVPTPAHAAAREHWIALEAFDPSSRDLAPEVTEPHILLQLENLTSTGRTNTYDVYVNLPDGADPSHAADHFAGRLDLFGIAEASRTTEQHAGTGLTYTFDITPIYQTLSGEQGWDPANIKVSLIPVRDWQGDTVTIGRISVSLA